MQPTRAPGRGVSWGRRARFLAASLAGGLSAVALTPALGAFADPGTSGPSQSVIVEAPDGVDVASLLALLPPGQARKALGIINGAAVSLNQHWISVLQGAGAIVTPDQAVTVQGAAYSNNLGCPGPTSPSTPSGNFVADTGADKLANRANQGQGVTVAVLDTGINSSLADLSNVVGGVDLTGGNSPFTDEYGHGTFVAGLVAGSGASSGGQYTGEAPGADLVSIKAAGASGVTTASTIISGISWAVQNQSTYNIGVLNLSFGALPTGPTNTEPMDRAVEAAWKAGIVVVVSAGNAGPFNGTIMSPGDDPLAITVGAYADNNSPKPANWAMCSFSSVGPTQYDGWFKPDLVAPGRSVVSVADPGSTIYTANPQALVGNANFVGSGTSFSAAITSGAAALVLSAHPDANPNGVKGRLVGNAVPGPAQDPFVDGHGVLNAFYAAQGPALRYDQTAARQAESNHPGSVIDLGSSWNGSSWNAANWTGSSWNGSSWNGSSWNGSSWNGSSWNGSSWNGSSWNGSSWNGSSWNGSSWNGSSWNSMVWDGSSWNGSSWNGSSWNGSSWNGSSWNGSSWNGSSWNGSSWNGSSWNGSSWN
ncbi:MAG TPA: S8 family peptidase [Acidimicrobiales bacterium]|nr:S8 family peptidase [Acidimicrobiales bacterium]